MPSAQKAALPNGQALREAEESAPKAPQGRPAARSDATFRSHERGFRIAEAMHKTNDAKGVASATARPDRPGMQRSGMED
jgi:hypothetical protein